MGTTRRELLGAGASAALGLLPWGSATPLLAQASPVRENAAVQTWDDGDLAHVLPTSSHDRILLKTSFKMRWMPRPFFRSGIAAYRAFGRILVDHFGNSMPAI